MTDAISAGSGSISEGETLTDSLRLVLMSTTLVPSKAIRKMLLTLFSVWGGLFGSVSVIERNKATVGLTRRNQVLITITAFSSDNVALLQCGLRRNRYS